MMTRQTAKFDGGPDRREHPTLPDPFLLRKIISKKFHLNVKELTLEPYVSASYFGKIIDTVNFYTQIILDKYYSHNKLVIEIFSFSPPR